MLHGMIHHHRKEKSNYVTMWPQLCNYVAQSYVFVCLLHSGSALVMDEVEHYRAGDSRSDLCQSNFVKPLNLCSDVLYLLQVLGACSRLIVTGRWWSLAL